MNKTTISRIGMLALLITGLLFGGCVRDSYEDCPRPFRLFIKAIDADQNDITESGVVRQAILFVFDENNAIVDAITLDAAHVSSRKATPITLDYPGHKSLKFVVWGNIDSSVEFPATASVKNYTDLYMKLKSGTESSICTSPCDLFYGSLDAPVEYGGFEPAGDQTVVISRRTAQVNIVAYGLKSWNENKEGTYTYRLRESKSAYDNNCTLTGETVGYTPSCSMDANGNLGAPTFRTLPAATGTGYVLDVLYNGEVIHTVDKDSNGNSFSPENGRMLNIILDFRANLSVKVVVTPWNQVFQYVEI